MMKSIGILFVVLLSWNNVSAQEDSVPNLRLWEHYCALFDSTQSVESFQQNLFDFNRLIESIQPVDTAEMVWNLGESIQIIFEDSLQFHYKRNWSWSGSWCQSSNELYMKGKPIYERTYPDFASLTDTTYFFEADSLSLIAKSLVTGELYNFWSGKKLRFTYQFIPMEEETSNYNRYPSRIELYPYQKIVEILKVEYEPINPNHRLKWYFENNLPDPR